MYKIEVMLNVVNATINVYFSHFLLLDKLPEGSESYQHLYNYKRIPELLSDQFNRTHFFNENLKTRSHTYLTPKVGRQEDL